MENDSDIITIYEIVQQTKTNSPEYKRVLHEFNIRRAEFDNTLTEQQRQELIELLQLKTDLNSIDSRENFVEGYKRGARLMIEILSKPDDE